MGLLFGAPWCPPWALLRQHLATVPEVSDFLREVNVDTHPHVADRHLVVTLPTLLVLSDGRELGRLIGSFTPAQAETLLRRATRTGDAEELPARRRS